MKIRRLQSRLSKFRERDLVGAAGLSEALQSRDVIGQAKGILMATRHIDSDTAFDLLRTTSQRRNVKLRTIADQVVFTGDLPDQ